MDSTSQDNPKSKHPQAGTRNPKSLVGLLLALADDEFILGYRNSEWTGISPMLEEDVAFSSMSQYEIGHARRFYQLLSGRGGVDADTVAFSRPVSGFLNPQFVDLPSTNLVCTLLL